MELKNEFQKAIACDSVGKPHSILGRAVCLTAHPGKMAILPFRKWFNKRYKGTYKFARLIFSFDLLLIGAVIGLGITALLLGFTQIVSFEDRITFEATVAPREIVSGAPSTLIIRYTNETDEELRNTQLTLSYPDDFLLQELSFEHIEAENGTINLGTLPVGGSGTVHVRGVMFGDVGGEQTFTSTMTFVHGEDRDIAGKKTSLHVFSPSSSTLSLTLTLPERLIAFQEVEGTITYKNIGEIDFPTISIEPEWPEGFTYISSPSAFTDGVFELPAIEGGSSGEFSFIGYLGDVGEEVTFIFHPSFTFGANRYRQETLTHDATVIPPQIQVNHSVDKSTLRAGSTALYTLHYENVGEFAVTNLVLGIESESPFFLKDVYTSESIPSIAPGASADVQIRVPLRASILQSETSVWEGLDVSTRVIATYTLGDGSGQRVISKGTSISSPITTPVVFESFGRYATASGDQLGRGPLPPRVGMETKYWIFWHMDGTINTLQNVRIEGTLGSGVEFTGNQSSSQNGGVSYDAASRTIIWTSDSIEPSLSPTSKIIGIGFELGLTPTDSMIDTIPLLLYDIRLTATDAHTGMYISRSGLTVTTNLPQDLMASEKALVEN
ncbi:hypothetical protein HQ487_03090 [Candidatus Uhrbacteria bacterium]|nr:hypothetical protein [Candidatus Uhrbacteria bacterium]